MNAGKHIHKRGLRRLYFGPKRRMRFARMIKSPAMSGVGPTRVATALSPFVIIEWNQEEEKCKHCMMKGFDSVGSKLEEKRAPHPMSSISPQRTIVGSAHQVL